MKERISIGQIVGVVMVLVVVVIVSSMFGAMMVRRSERVAGSVGAPVQQGGDAGVDCSQLITPERVGP